MALTPGSRLGPYEILSPLGTGGMGEVYRASDPRLGREVAIKVLPASYSQDTDRLRRFEQEARAAGVRGSGGRSRPFGHAARRCAEGAAPATSTASVFRGQVTRFRGARSLPK